MCGIDEFFAHLVKWQGDIPATIEALNLTFEEYDKLREDERFNRYLALTNEMFLTQSIARARRREKENLVDLELKLSKLGPKLTPRTISPNETLFTINFIKGDSE